MSSADDLAFDAVSPEAQKYVTNSLNRLLESGGGKAKASDLEAALQDYAGWGDVENEAFNSLLSGKVKPNPDGGSIYGVSVDTDEPLLLDWDKPFAEQADAVKLALSKAAPGVDYANPLQFYDPHHRGQSYYFEHAYPRSNPPKGLENPEYKLNGWSLGSVEKSPRGDGFNSYVKNLGHDPGPGDWRLSESGGLWMGKHGNLDEARSALMAYAAPLAEQNPVTGGAAYQRLARSLDESNRYFGGNREEASRLLKENGVPGIKFLDQYSRNGGNGTSNYVIFDDGIVKIVSKNGKIVEEASGDPQMSFGKKRNP